MQIAAGKVVTPNEVLAPGWVEVHNGLITAVAHGVPVSTDVVSLPNNWLIPGFVDMHCHGGGGSAFTDANSESIAAAVQAHRRHGTTTLVASLVSAPIPRLVDQVSRLRELAQDQLIAGIHLEGPFLAPTRCGAHDPAALQAPTPEAVQTLINAGNGFIRMMTVAPELTNGIKTIRQLVAHNVIAAVGHTDATEERTLAAITAGATVATHLFNQMRPMTTRDPGVVGVLLDDDRVTIELICDLVHVHPRVIRLAARYAGPGRTVLVTDAMAAAGAGDGNYQLGDVPVSVQNGVSRLANNQLAGSTLTMDAALRNLVAAGGLTMMDAVMACATRPAELLRLSTGSITPGLAADLVLLNPQLQVAGVLHQGQWALSPH